MNDHPPTPCCNYVGIATMPHPVQWNPYNGVVQCHNCGHQYEPVGRKLESDLRNMILECWTAMRGAYNRFDTIREQDKNIYVDSDMANLEKHLPHLGNPYGIKEIDLMLMGCRGTFLSDD